MVGERIMPRSSTGFFCFNIKKDDDTDVENEAADDSVDEHSPLLKHGSDNGEAMGILKSQHPEQRAISTIHPSNKVSSCTVIFMVLMISAGVSQLDTSLALTTHPQIASEFNSLSESSWLITRYSLAMAAAQPLIGKLSDIYGRKCVLLTSNTLFSLGCIQCGAAGSFLQVVLGRILSGIGAAGMSASVAIIITDIVPIRDVGPWRGYVNLVGTTCRSLGAPLGGYLADTIGWRWSFTSQAPILTVASILVIFIVPPSLEEFTDNKLESLSARKKLLGIDFTGAFLLTLTILGMMLPLSIGGQQIPWDHPVIFISLVASVACLVLFILTEHSWSSNPIIPPRLMKSKDVMASYGALAFQAAAHIGMMFSVPIHFQVAEGTSSSAAGLRLVPAVIGSALGGVVTGCSMKWTGTYKPQILLGVTLSACANALLFFQWREKITLAASMFIFPGGFGASSVGSATYLAVTAALDPSLTAVATSSQYLAQSLGQTSGLSAASAVMRMLLQRALENNLQGVPNSPMVIDRATNDATYIRSLDGDVKRLVITSYAQSLTGIHGLSITLNFIAFTFAACIKGHRF